MTGQAEPTVMHSLLCTPIGFVASPYRQRIDAPHQPSVVQGTATGDARRRGSFSSMDVPPKRFAILPASNASG
jgi:hypothetical protein